jgi:hypothetical protein
MRKYGPNRMDKVMFCGCVKVEGLEWVGMGVEIQENRVLESMPAIIGIREPRSPKKLVMHQSRPPFVLCIFLAWEWRQE